MNSGCCQGCSPLSAKSLIHSLIRSLVRALFSSAVKVVVLGIERRQFRRYALRFSMIVAPLLKMIPVVLRRRFNSRSSSFAIVIIEISSFHPILLSVGQGTDLNIRDLGYNVIEFLVLTPFRNSRKNCQKLKNLLFLEHTVTMCITVLHSEQVYDVRCALCGRAKRSATTQCARSVLSSKCKCIMLKSI
jgi:hypothetical protein